MKNLKKYICFSSYFQLISLNSQQNFGNSIIPPLDLDGHSVKRAYSKSLLPQLIHSWAGHKESKQGGNLCGDDGGQLNHS